MVRHTLAACAAAAALGFAFSASAQPGHDHGPQGNPHGGPPGHVQGPRGPQGHGHDMRHDDHRGGPPPRYDGPPPRHAGYPEYRRYNRGDRLPQEFRSRQYVVNDWHARGLRQPPRGSYWVQNGSDYVLAAVATGIISAVVINAIAN